MTFQVRVLREFGVHRHLVEKPSASEKLSSENCSPGQWNQRCIFSPMLLLQMPPPPLTPPPPLVLQSGERGFCLRLFAHQAECGF